MNAPPVDQDSKNVKMTEVNDEQKIDPVGSGDGRDRLPDLLAVETLNDNQDSGSGGSMADSDLATRGQIDDVNQPRVAKKSRQKIATRGTAAEVIDLAARRDKRQKMQQDEFATRGKKLVGKKTRKGIGEWRVDAVKASTGTWAFRLRRRENGIRTKPVYVSRVANAVYEMIREGDYGSFKEQLVASHMPGALRASHRA